MKNGFGEIENGLSTLLVHVKLESKQPSQITKSSTNDLSESIKNFRILQKQQKGNTTNFLLNTY